MPRVCRWRWPAPCARRTCRWSAPPAPTSPVSARPPAATAGARGRSTRRASVPCVAACASTPPRGVSMSPATWSRWATLRALLLARGGGDGVAPGRGGLLGPLQQVVEDLRGGLGLDQAAQAEADVPALVALDALDALAHPGQGAVGQVVEQRVLPGVEDDPLEQHVVEADALGEPGAARRELGGHRRQPLLEELEQRGRDVLPGRGAPLGRRRLRAARAPRRRCGRRAARGAARRGAGGRRPRPSGSPGRPASPPGPRRRTA